MYQTRPRFKLLPTPPATPSSGLEPLERRALPADVRHVLLPSELCDTLAYIARRAALAHDERRPMTRISKVDPADYVPIVGSTFAKHDHTPLLVIGGRSWDRWQLGRLGCPHPAAAAALNRVLQELRITSIAGLARQVHEIGRYKGLGVTAYWLVLALLRSDGYDVKEVHGVDVTYNTLKLRARKALKERRRKPRRAGPPSESATA